MFFALLAAGCRPNEPAPTAGPAPLEVIVSVPPIADLVERIGGENVEVHVLSSAGACAHRLTLTPRQLVDLGEARLFLLCGMPFEQGVAEKLRAVQRPLQVIDIARGIPRRRQEAADHDDAHCDAGPECNHEHGHEHDHAHEAAADDPHIWLAPQHLRTLAGHIAAALVEADPPRAADYRARLAALDGQIAAVGQRVERVLKPLRGQTIYVYHPAFGYLADAYGLRQKAVEAGGRAPAPRQLGELIAQARADQVRAIFVETQSDPRAAQAVADAIGCAVVPVDPLAKDALGNLETVAAKLAGEESL